MNTAKQKAELRQYMLNQLSQLDDTKIEQASSTVCQKVLDKILELQAKTIAWFLPIGNEINLLPCS